MLAFLLAPTFLLATASVGAQSTASPPKLPSAGNSRPAIEELLGMDSTTLDLGPPSWGTERPVPTTSGAPRSGSSEKALPQPFRFPSANTGSEPRTTSPSFGNSIHFDDFFSAEMKALLEGSTRSRDEMASPASNPKPNNSALLQPPPNTEPSNVGNSNPLRSNLGANPPPSRQRQSPPSTESRTASGSTSVAPHMVATNMAAPHRMPPRPVANTNDARPLINSNQRSQSLLMDTGSIGLLSSEFEDTLDLPPPYSIDNENVTGTPNGIRSPRHLGPAPSSATPLNRPLSEAVTSPNLPIQMGFHVEELEVEDPNATPIKNQMDPADFAALVQKQSQVPKQSQVQQQTQPQVRNEKRPSTAAQVGFSASDRPNAGQAINPNRTVAARLFEFEKLRQQFMESLSEDRGPVANSDVAADTTYWIWRGDFAQARDQLANLNSTEKKGFDPWELAWLTAEVTIGLKDPILLEQAEQQMLQQWPQNNRDRNSLDRSEPRLESIYIDFVSANRSLLKAEPDYVAAIAGLRRVLEQVAEQVPQSTPWARQRLSWILLCSQLEMARCIALGPYRSAPASADQWFQQASSTAEQLIQAEIAVPLVRVIVVSKQIECYAESGRFREIPPLANYLATWEHQLQTQGLTDEALWVRQQAIALGLRCGLMAYNHQQMNVAQTWVTQVIPRLERLNRSNHEALQTSHLAAAYWLQGAIQMQAGQPEAAVRSFDVARQHWPAALELQQDSNGLEWGERLAIMAVAYWNQGDTRLAALLNQDAIVLIQNAIDASLASPARIETPLANLALMTEETGAIVGLEAADLSLTNTVVLIHSEASPTEGAAVTPVGLELDEIREQLESPVATAASNGAAPQTAAPQTAAPQTAAPQTAAPQSESPRPTITRSSVPQRQRLPSRAMLR